MDLNPSLSYHLPNALPLYYQTYVKKTVQALYILYYIN